MGLSSMGNKATRTGKCKCDNHKWRIFEKRETSSNDIVITIDCANCRALWDTRSITDEIISLMSEKDIEWYKGVLSRKIKLENRGIEILAEEIQEAEKERNKKLVNINKIQEKLNSL